MKRVLVTFVLALTTAAWGQGSSPSQQPPAGTTAGTTAAQVNRPRQAIHKPTSPPARK